MGEREYYLEHLLRLEQYSGRLTRIYKSYIDEFIEISKTVKIDPDKPFSFSDYPQTLERVNKTLSSIADNVKIFFDQATRDEWIESNIKSDALIGTILKNTKIPKSQLEQFYNRNLSALERFQQRKIDGMDLSDRIWRNTEQFKSQIEFGIDTAIGEGRSAAQLARDVKGYLQDPDKLFRRVRNRRGNLVLSKQAEAFNPGRGRYRSSYKNSERLARTEINMSYREADINRYQSLPFVVGYEIRRSNNPYPCIVCETLQGRYPKTFRFNGFHPNCRCSIISILATEEERRAIRRMVLNGEDLSTFHSVNEVTDVPEAFKKYVYDNLDTFERRKSTPYWIRDNFKYGDISLGLDLKRMKPIAPVKSKSSYNRETNKWYIAETKNQVKQFNMLSQKIAKDTSSKVTDVNVKSDKRIYEKALLDYNGDVTKVKDIIRNTFIASSSKHSDIILQEIRKVFEVYRIKVQEARKDPLGYSGILLNIRLKNDTFAEIQINSATMIYGKDLDSKNIIGYDLFKEIKETSKLEPGLGHKYYEEWRGLNRSNISELTRMKEIEKLSQEYYRELRKLNM